MFVYTTKHVKHNINRVSEVSDEQLAKETKNILQNP